MISCHLYDYIEIACMHKYPVKFILKTGKVVECVAIDTQYNEIKEECIKVHLSSNQQTSTATLKSNAVTSTQNSLTGKDALIVLDTIESMKVLIENPHFSFVSFT